MKRLHLFYAFLIGVIYYSCSKDELSDDALSCETELNQEEEPDYSHLTSNYYINTDESIGYSSSAADFYENISYDKIISSEVINDTLIIDGLYEFTIDSVNQTVFEIIEPNPDSEWSNLSTRTIWYSHDYDSIYMDYYFNVPYGTAGNSDFYGVRTNSPVSSNDLFEGSYFLEYNIQDYGESIFIEAEDTLNVIFNPELFIGEYQHFHSGIFHSYFEEEKYSSIPYNYYEDPFSYREASLIIEDDSFYFNETLKLSDSPPNYIPIYLDSIKSVYNGVKVQ